MCTLVILRRPGHGWPLLLAANRDEMMNRPWLSPGRHWPEQPYVVGGLDQVQNGTWLALSDHGVVAAVLNRYGTLGTMADKSSRGTLPLLALQHPCAAEALTALVNTLDPQLYQACNMIIADGEKAFWLAIKPDANNRLTLTWEDVPPGVSLVSSGDLNDASHLRTSGYLARFKKALPPQPEKDEWTDWQTLLSDRQPVSPSLAQSAICFCLSSGYGTVSSSLIALSAKKGHNRWLFAPGPPDTTPFHLCHGQAMAIKDKV